jgi:heme a synthase
VTDRRFTQYSVFVLVYNVLVVLFGAVVRATESGAGCGANWPTCGGELVPSGAETATLIEFTHRATSGVALLLVGALALWAIRTRPKGDAARWMAIAAGVLIINEALIGAMLVLFEWVADDESIGRVISIVVHLVNTFLLLGALALVSWFSSGERAPTRPWPRRHLGPLRWAATGLLIVSALGAITALGDTLFPPEAVGAGFFDDFGGTFIVRLRWIHPVVAVATTGYLLWMLNRTEEVAPRPSAALRILVLIQVGAGVVNVALLAPTWMQIVHLLVADAVWILFVVLAATVLAARPESNA